MRHAEAEGVGENLRNQKQSLAVSSSSKSAANSSFSGDQKVSASMPSGKQSEAKVPGKTGKSSNRMFRVDDPRKAIKLVRSKLREVRAEQRRVKACNNAKLAQLDAISAEFARTRQLNRLIAEDNARAQLLIQFLLAQF